MLNVNPLKRPTIKTIMNHTWVSAENRFLTGEGLCSDPSVLAQALMEGLMNNGFVERAASESDDIQL
jgi:hypothetical protein